MVYSETIPLDRHVDWCGGETIGTHFRAGLIAADPNPSRGDLGAPFGAEPVHELRDSTDRVIERFENLFAYRSTDTTDPRAKTLRKAIIAGDLDTMAAYGIDLRDVRFDLLAQLGIGRPTELQVISYTETPNSTNNDHHEDREPSKQATIGLQVGQLLNYINDSLRTNVLVMHQGQHDQGRARHTAQQAVGELLRWRVIEPSDPMDSHLHVKLANKTDLNQLTPLLELLRKSPYGTITQLSEPHTPHEQPPLTAFMPHAPYIEYAAHLTDMPPEVIARAGIPLYGSGRAEESAILAADSLDKHPQALRITVEPERRRQLYLQAAALGRLANSARMELSQAIYYDGNSAANLLITTAFIGSLLPHLRLLRRNLGTFANPRFYDANEYNRHNYQAAEVRAEQARTGQESPIPGMLLEDYECRKALIEELSARYSPKQFARMYDFGCGPGISLAHIMEAYIRDADKGGSITMIDVSPSSIDFQNRWISGILDPKDAEVAQLNQQLFSQTQAGDLYVHEQEDGRKLSADDRARSLAYTQQGSLEQLPPESCDVITEGYVTCSSGRILPNGEPDPIPPTLEDFCDKQNRKYGVLQAGGIAVSMHMLNRTNWNSIDTKTQKPIEIASVNLSPEEVLQAYRDAGFTNVYGKVVEINNPHHVNTGVDQNEPLQQVSAAKPVAMMVIIAEKPREQYPRSY